MYFEWEGKSHRLAVLALTIGLILGTLLGYSFGRSAPNEAEYFRGYCDGLDIADTTCWEAGRP